MQVEEFYSAVPCENGDLIFVITDKGTESKCPRMEFDGHMALLRLDNKKVLLKNIHSDLMKSMEPLKQVFVGEVDKTTDEIVRLYPVPLLRVTHIDVSVE